MGWSGGYEKALRVHSGSTRASNSTRRAVKNYGKEDERESSGWLAHCGFSGGGSAGVCGWKNSPFQVTKIRGASSNNEGSGEDLTAESLEGSEL